VFEGTAYDIIEDNRFSLSDQIFSNFWKCINICHDVCVIKIHNKKVYSGSSQDEISLLETSKESKIC
jgi:hypothetical protein